MSMPPPAPGVASDAARLRELGYEQELRRGLGALDNVAVGFVTISPVVALYGVVLVGMTVAGGAWLWMLPVALAGQCLLLATYSELASEFPIAHGSYQWSRRLLGPKYAWFNGWVGLCAFVAANTVTAYLGAPWALAVLGITPTPNVIVFTAMVLVVACASVNLGGVVLLRRAVRVGLVAEVGATIAVGVILLLAFREQEFASLTDLMGAEAVSGGSGFAALLAALAVAGWAFLGFDACGLTAEETRGAARHVPRAVWLALLSVAAIVILNAFAITLAHPRPQDVVAGSDVDPVTTAVVASFGSWSTRPFAALTLIAFLACSTAAQASTARAVYSVARDGVLPGSRLLRTVDRRQVPIGAVAVTGALTCALLLVGLNSTAIGSLIAFGAAGLYATLLLVATAALIARIRGTWTPAGPVRLGRAGLVLNALAVAWLLFETVNIAWPRESFAPAGAPWYQIWAAPLVLAVIAVAGLAYLVIARPHRRPALREAVSRPPA